MCEPNIGCRTRPAGLKSLSLDVPIRFLIPFLPPPALDADHGAWRLPNGRIHIRAHAAEGVAHHSAANHDEAGAGPGCAGDYLCHLTAFHDYFEIRSSFFLKFCHLLARPVEQEFMESAALPFEMAWNFGRRARREPASNGPPVPARIRMPTAIPAGCSSSTPSRRVCCDTVWAAWGHCRCGRRSTPGMSRREVLSGNRTEQESPERAMTVRRHHDQIDLFFIGVLDDPPRRVAFE